MRYHGLLQNWKCLYCFYRWARGGVRLSALQAEFVWLTPGRGAGRQQGALTGLWLATKNSTGALRLRCGRASLKASLTYCVWSTQTAHHFLSLSHDPPPPPHLSKNGRKLCPEIEVSLFRFYFLKLSSNYQKVFSNLFSNCWKIPKASLLPSPATENASTPVTKCLNHKQRSHFPNHHVYLDWGGL